MKHIVCAVYDAAVGQYLPPFFQRSKMEALRAFQSAVNNPDHDFGKFPDDFSLHALGEWDAENGKFEDYTAPERLAVAFEVLSREPERQQLDLVAEADH